MAYLGENLLSLFIINLLDRFLVFTLLLLFFFYNPEIGLVLLPFLQLTVLDYAVGVGSAARMARFLIFGQFVHHRQVASLYDG